MTPNARLLLSALLRVPDGIGVSPGDAGLTPDEADAAGIELEAGITVSRMTTGDVPDPRYVLETPAPRPSGSPKYDSPLD